MTKMVATAAIMWYHSIADDSFVASDVFLPLFEGTDARGADAEEAEEEEEAAAAEQRGAGA